MSSPWYYLISLWFILFALKATAEFPMPQMPMPGDSPLQIQYHRSLK